MKRYCVIALLSFAFSAMAFGQQCVPSNIQSCTANVQLATPFINAPGPQWANSINQNTNWLDQLLSGNANLSRLSFLNGTITGNITFPGVVTFASSGAFTNTQMNVQASSAVNGINFSTEYQAAQGANFSTEGFAAGVVVPSSSTVHQADGIAGYVTNSSTSTNAVGVYSQCRALVNSSTCWGANFVSRDVAGLTTGITLYGNEIDVNPLNATSAYSGVNGFLMNLNTSGTGTYPGNGAFYVTSSLNASWFVGFQTGDAAAATAGIFGATCTVGNCGSQVLKFRGFNTGSLFTATIGSDSLGNITLTPAAGKATQLLNGVANDASGFKHLRGTTGCTTAASVGAVCTTVVTWTTAFADANYTATCTGDLITSGVPVNGGLTAKAAASVTFQTVATTAAAAKFTAIDCTAVHD